MEQELSKRATALRKVVFILCQGFCLFSIPYLAVTAGGTETLLAIVSVVLVCLPPLLEKLFHCRMATGLYAFCVLYAVGSLLGHGYDFYYRIPWWDLLLHLCGGVVFGVLGVFLVEILNRRQPCTMLLTAVFALCFSMAISVLWEFFEYAMDTFFVMDMQNDSVVTAIHSYLLGSGPGELATIPDITAVTVNGVPLPMEGYIDIGLHDTMGDMLIEAAGSLICVGLYAADRGRHPLLRVL